MMTHARGGALDASEMKTITASFVSSLTGRQTFSVRQSSLPNGWPIASGTAGRSQRVK